MQHGQGQLVAARIDASCGGCEDVWCRWGGGAAGVASQNGIMTSEIVCEYLTPAKSMPATRLAKLGVAASATRIAAC